MKSESASKVMSYVIILGSTISGVIALVVILAAVALPLFRDNAQLPEFLQQWGGLIIGFYFGSFVTLLKDWAGIASRSDVQNENVNKVDV